MAGGNCADRVVQGALRRPTGGQLLMLGLGGHTSGDVSGTLQEELTQRVPRPIIEGSCFERCLHMLQPGAPLHGANAEPFM